MADSIGWWMLVKHISLGRREVLQRTNVVENICCPVKERTLDGVSMSGSDRNGSRNSLFAIPPKPGVASSLTLFSSSLSISFSRLPFSLTIPPHRPSTLSFFRSISLSLFPSSLYRVSFLHFYLDFFLSLSHSCTRFWISSFFPSSSTFFRVFVRLENRSLFLFRLALSTAWKTRAFLNSVSTRFSFHQMYVWWE